MADQESIDIHTHILPDTIPNFASQFGYGDFISLDHHKSEYAMMMKGSTPFREIYCNCWDPNRRKIEMNSTHVTKQVLSTVPVMFSYWAKPKDGVIVSRFLNDHISEVVNENPDTFFGLGTLPMQDPEMAVEELDRCMNDLELQGIEIGSHINAWNLNDEVLFPVFQRAEQLGAAIFVHPWDMMAMDSMRRYWLPWLVGMPAETSLAICSMIFGGVFARLPKLRVAFAHGGGSFPMTVGRIEHGFNVRPDLVAIDNNVNPKEYLGRFWLDSLVHDPIVLKYIVDLVGENRVCMGSDYPFPLGEHNPGELIRSMNLDESLVNNLLSKNALEWLGKN